MQSMSTFFDNFLIIIMFIILRTCSHPLRHKCLPKNQKTVARKWLVTQNFEKRYYFVQHGEDYDTKRSRCQDLRDSEFKCDFKETILIDDTPKTNQLKKKLTKNYRQSARELENVLFLKNVQKCLRVENCN